MNTHEDTDDGHDFPDRYAAYREHLAKCPRRHLGLLTDCVEGAQLRAAWTRGERTHA
ncbi:hypothetical protein RB200_20670 [Streptomyces sp. PmtG]